MCEHCKESGMVFTSSYGKLCAICYNQKLCIVQGSKQAQTDFDKRAKQ